MFNKIIICRCWVSGVILFFKFPLLAHFHDHLEKVFLLYMFYFIMYFPLGCGLSKKIRSNYTDPWVRWVQMRPDDEFPLLLHFLFRAVESDSKLRMRGKPQLNECEDNSDTHECSEGFFSHIFRTSERRISSFWWNSDSSLFCCFTCFSLSLSLTHTYTHLHAPTQIDQDRPGMSTPHLICGPFIH